MFYTDIEIRAELSEIFKIVNIKRKKKRYLISHEENLSNFFVSYRVPKKASAFFFLSHHKSSFVYFFNSISILKVIVSFFTSSTTLYGT